MTNVMLLLRRLRMWKTLVAIISIIAVLTLVMWLVVKTAEKKAWALMEQRVAELKESITHEPKVRPALREQPLPGNAWDDYAWALREVVAGKSAGEQVGLSEKLSLCLSAAGRDYVLGIKDLLDRYKPCIDRLRDGVRRTPQDPPSDLDVRPPHTSVGWASSPASLLALIAACHVRAIDQKASPRERVGMLLDIVQFVRDLSATGLGAEGLWEWNYTLLLGELRTVALGSHLSVPDLLETDRELEILERSSPPHHFVMRKYLADLGDSLIKNGEWIILFVSIGSYPESAAGQRDLRYGFSKRLLCASAFLRACSWLDRQSECDRLPWSEILQLQQAFEKEMIGFQNENIVSMCSPLYPEGEASRRACLARIRLLRAAVHYLATGEVQELPDPFGITLRHASKGAELMFWSVGPEGTNHGGHGGWEIAPSQDILISTPRKS